MNTIRLLTLIPFLCLPLTAFAYTAMEQRNTFMSGAEAEEEGFVDLSNGQTLHYLARGKRGNPLLLFIHGAPERAEVWRDYMKVFSHNHFTVAYTSRGYYPSSIPPGIDQYTVDILAADALAMAQSFGYDKFTVIGHDWGAVTAWQAGINYPDNVERLVIFGSPHPIVYSRAYYESEEHRQSVDAYIPLIRESIAPWTPEGTLANNLELLKYDVYTEREKQQIPWSLGLLFEDTWLYENGASIDAIHNHYKALDWPPTTLNTCNPLPSISLTVEQPVLLFYGEQDRFISPEAHALPDNDCNPDTIYVSFPDGDHFIHHQYKPEIMSRMLRFFFRQGL